MGLSERDLQMIQLGRQLAAAEIAARVSESGGAFREGMIAATYCAVRRVENFGALFQAAQQADPAVSVEQALAAVAAARG